jgi:hypothetical protein
LTGARTPKERIAVVKLIDRFRNQPTPEAVWDEAGDHNAILKSKGLNVPFPDLLLATSASIRTWKSGHGISTSR